MYLLGRNKIWKREREMLTMYLEKEELEALEEIRWRERKGKGAVAREAILEYIKVHGSGNDTYKLDNFQDANFQAVPAFLSDMETWVNHYKNSNEKDRTNLRIRQVELGKKFRMVDINT